MKRIRLKVILTIILAIIVGILIYSYLDSLKQEVQIYITTDKVGAGQIIQKDCIDTAMIRERGSETIIQGALKELREDDIIIAAVDIGKGDILKEKDIIIGTKESLTEKGLLNYEGEINSELFLEDNKRLHTIILDGAGSVGNSLTKGDVVDVIYTSETDKQKSESYIIMNNILVDSVGAVSSQDGQAMQAITLVVTQQQSVKLSFAKRNGIIDLSLSPPANIYNFTDTINSDNVYSDR